MDNEAAALLNELGTLRRRTRRDSRSHWLPLLVFGVLVLAAPLAYLGAGGGAVIRPDGPVVRIGGFDFTPLSLFAGPNFSANYLVVNLYWLGAAAIGAAITFWWYRKHGAAIGVQLPVGTYLGYAAGAIVMAVIGIPAVTDLLLYYVLGGSNVFSTLVSLLFLIAGMAVIGWSVRPRTGRSTGKKIVCGAGIVLALVGAGNVTVLASTHGYVTLYLIATGLLALAWIERSVLCGTVALLFTGASLLANLYDLENVFYRLGVVSFTPATVVFENLLLPGAVLVIGGIVALVVTRPAKVEPTS